MSPGLNEFQQQSSGGGIWQSLNRFLLTLIVLSVLTAVGYRSLPELSKQREQDARSAQLQAEIEKERQLLARNTREEFLLKHDREYVSLVARDRLDLMKEGETIYRLEMKPDKSKMRLME